MPATIGADDVDFFEFPRPAMLKEITGLNPEPSGVHVLLDKHLGVQSTQRFALGETGGGIEVALWPGELKAQAEYLYRDGRAQAMIAAARMAGWNVVPSPHLAFFNSSPDQRLYMTPDVDAVLYAERWEGSDGQQIGRHPRDEIRDVIWPWLKQRGYASEADDAELRKFLSILGRRPADLRPGMRFRKRWDAATTRDRRAFAEIVRSDVNSILAAGDEPTLTD